MTQLMDHFTDELGWEGDLCDQKSTNKWRAEVAEILKRSPTENKAKVTKADAEEREDVGVTEKMINWVRLSFGSCLQR